MKESTIIQQFNLLNKKCNMLAEALKNQEKHIQKIYMIENAVSVTMDAFIKTLTAKGVVSDEEIKLQIETETKKRQAKRNEVKNKEVEAQPDFGANTNLMPSSEPEVEADQPVS
jgi:plasmid maintenance system antidote protein VapI